MTPAKAILRLSHGPGITQPQLTTKVSIKLEHPLNGIRTMTFMCFWCNSWRTFEQASSVSAQHFLSRKQALVSATGS